MVERLHALAVEEAEKERAPWFEGRPASGECLLHLDGSEMDEGIPGQQTVCRCVSEVGHFSCLVSNVRVISFGDLDETRNRIDAAHGATKFVQERRPVPGPTAHIDDLSIDRPGPPSDEIPISRCHGVHRAQNLCVLVSAGTVGILRGTHGHVTKLIGEDTGRRISPARPLQQKCVFGEGLIVAGPHPLNVNDLAIREHLIDKSVLDVDAP